MTAGVKQRAVVFDDFSGGEFGSLGSWAAPKGSFTGQNVMRYIDGSLGPRNGLKQYTLTGVPASAALIVAGVQSSYLYFQVASFAWYRFDPTTFASQAVTSIGAGAEAAEQLAPGEVSVYYITPNNGIRKIVPGAVSAVAGSPNGTNLVKYGERMVAAGNSSEPQRLYYSAAGDPESWPAGNYIDVGAGSAIVDLVVVRGGLAILTTNSTLGQLAETPRWWMLTGVPGVNDVLREVVSAQGSYEPRGRAVLQDGRVAFAAPSSEMPAFFDGSQVTLVRHLPLGTFDVSDLLGVAAMRDESDVLFVSDVAASSNGAYGYLRRDRTWLKQVFSEANVSVTMTHFSGLGWVVFADKSGTPAFYAWSVNNDRPPFASDDYASVLTPSAVHFTLPDIQAERGEQIAVRKVTVWFRDWNTGGSDNQFTVNVTPVRQYEAGDGTTQTGKDSAGNTPSFSRTAASSSTSGVNLRRDWQFAEDWGDCARLKISDMRGVAIHRIEVILDTKPDLA